MIKEEAEKYWYLFYKDDKEALDFASCLMKRQYYHDSSSPHGWDIDEKLPGKRCDTKEDATLSNLISKEKEVN